MKIICSKSPESDIEKLTVAFLDAQKDFDSIDPATLQGLQPLVQWVTDLCLYLLTWLPDIQAYSSLPGHMLVRNKQFLSNIRLILVLVRIWGKQAPFILPQYTVTTSGLDVLITMFRLVTSLWHAIGEGETVDEDECCHLATQLVVPMMSVDMFGRANTPLAIFCQPHPVKFTYGSEPHSQRPSLQNLPDGQKLADYTLDVKTKISLGFANRRPQKMCSRCGSVTLFDKTGSSLATNTEQGLFSLAINTWNIQWKQCCCCTGHWRVINY